MEAHVSLLYFVVIIIFIWNLNQAPRDAKLFCFNFGYLVSLSFVRTTFTGPTSEGIEGFFGLFAGWFCLF